jgi:hypothetical protein
MKILFWRKTLAIKHKMIWVLEWWNTSYLDFYSCTYLHPKIRSKKIERKSSPKTEIMPSSQCKKKILDSKLDYIKIFPQKSTFFVTYVNQKVIPFFWSQARKKGSEFLYFIEKLSVQQQNLRSFAIRSKINSWLWQGTVFWIEVN